MQFSVIIPLESHRFHASECVKAWCSGQDIPAEEYEILCVTPPEFPARELADLKGLLRPHDRMVMSQERHDIAHCAEGALVASGNYLFFTESHVVASSGVLKQCADAFEEHPDWAALCCRSVPIVRNRLARVEADMYGEDIAYAMTVHPWRRILDQCFVTSRRAYLATGGFQAELGHFAEWELAGRYHAHELAIGFAPEIELSHHYSGDLRELRTFTKDFTAGEISYLARGDGVKPADLLEAPSEWLQRGNWNRSIARSILTSKPEPTMFRRWLPAALGGMAFARACSLVNVVRSRTSLEFSRRFRSNSELSRRFIAYIEALIHAGRLKSISELPQPAPGEGDSLMELPNLAHRCGFHRVELFDGQPFVWSEPVAGVELHLEAGAAQLVLRCAAIRSPLAEQDLTFWFNGARIPVDHMEFCGYEAAISVEAPGGISTLTWACEPFNAPGDLRLLGLPIVDLDIRQKQH